MNTPTTTSTTVTPQIVPASELAGRAAFLGPIRTVGANQRQIAFRQFGSGPDLVLIAGQASPMSLWPLSLLSWLADRHRVTMYDNRELGSSTATGAEFTLPDLADDAAGLITALGLERPAVFGWSTGGEVGLLLASRHPAAVSKLVISGATPGGPNSVKPPTEVIDLFADPNADTTKLLDVLFSPDGDAAQQAFVADYLEVPQSPVTAAAAAAYDQAERAYWDGPEPKWSAITAPVLVMNGDADFAVPTENARYIAQALGSRATLDIDAGGRHAWFLEHPERFQSSLSAFLG